MVEARARGQLTSGQTGVQVNGDEASACTPEMRPQPEVEARAWGKPLLVAHLWPHWSARNVVNGDRNEAPACGRG